MNVIRAARIKTKMESKNLKRDAIRIDRIYGFDGIWD